MSITAPELNYLVFRYLQEAGLEVPSYALASEIDVLALSNKFNDKIPQGELVDLVQKGILYNHIRDYSQENESLDNIGDMLNSIIPYSTLKLNQIQQQQQQQNNNNSIDNIDYGLNDVEFTKVLNIISPFEGANLVKCLNDDLIVHCKKLKISITNLLQSNKNISYQLNELNNDDDEITFIEITNKLIIIGLKSGGIKIFDFQLKLINSFNIHQWPILKILKSPEFTNFVSLDLNGGLIIWDLITMTCIFNFDTKNKENCQINWISNSKLLFNFDNSISILNLNNFEQIKLPICHSSKILHLISIGGDNNNNKKFISIDSTNELKIWSNLSNYPIKSLILSSFPISVYSFFLNNEEKLLIVGIDGCIKILNIKNLKCSSIISIPDGSGCLMSCFNKLNLKFGVLSSLGQISIFEIGDFGFKSIGAFSSLKQGSIQDISINNNYLIIGDLNKSGVIPLL